MKDDLDQYIEKRKHSDAEFAYEFDSGYNDFKIGVILKNLREESGLTQDQLADLLKTKKSAISRIENHAEDIKFSTIRNYAKALNKHLRLEIF